MAFPLLPISIAQTGFEFLNQLYPPKLDYNPLPSKAYFPNYPGDVLGDLLNNPLINWNKFLSKAPVYGNLLRNQGIDPNSFSPRSPLRYSIPAPSYLGAGGLPGRTSYPQNFTPFTPAFNTVFSNADQFMFKPDPGFQMNPGTNGGQSFGTSPLFNAPNLEPQVTLEDLMKTLSTDTSKQLFTFPLLPKFPGRDLFYPQPIDPMPPKSQVFSFTGQ